MSAMAVVASVAVGLAFLLAGGSKLAAGSAWPAQASGLGAPAVVVPVVPWLELVVGATLVLQIAEPLPAVAALTLLVVFTTLIGVRLSQGEHPPCACFGAWSAKPIGPAHLLRNGVLMMLSIVALTG